MRLAELNVYKHSIDIGERIWMIVAEWDWFARDTLGKQWVKAADSMAANLSEGFRRFYFKENRQFGYYARGSLFETKTWLEKAQHRKLVTDADYTELARELRELSVQMNHYIKSIGREDPELHEGAGLYPLYDE